MKVVGRWLFGITSVVRVLILVPILCATGWSLLSSRADGQTREYIYGGDRLILSIGPAPSPTGTPGPTPTATPTPPDPAPIGSHDTSDCSYTQGWACDASNYNTSLQVDVYTDANVYLGSTAANLSRSDMPVACGGNPNGNSYHAFAFLTPSFLKDGQPHNLYVRALNINGSGQTVGGYVLLPDNSTQPPGTPAGAIAITCTDSQAPTVSVTAPANGSTVSGTTNVTATASDNTVVSRVEFYLDAALKSTSTSSPYAYTWNTAASDNGTHTLMAKAFDPAGNSASAQVSVTVSNQGPAGWWKLDEGSGTTTVDATGDGNTGTLISSPTWATGIIAGAVSFNGTTSYVSIPDSAFLDGMGQLTVAAWIKLSSVGQVSAPVGKDTTGQSYRFALASNGSGSFMVVTTANAWKTAGTIASWTQHFTANTWYHVVGTYDGSMTRVYVNGVLAGSGANAISGSIVNSASPLYFGYKSGTGISDPYSGAVDDVRVYRRALSASEVLALYQAH